MPLFKSKHAQASNERVAAVNSSDTSPTHIHPDAAYPQIQQQSQQIYTGSQQQQQIPSQLQFPRPERYDQQSPDDRPLYHDPRVASHPAHILTRHGSTHLDRTDELSNIGQPSVHVVPPTSPQTDRTAPVPGKTSFGQSRSVHTEKEQKRSKRSLFGITGGLTGGLGLKDRDIEREREREREREEKRTSSDARYPGRASSTHMVKRPQDVPPESSIPPAGPAQYQSQTAIDHPPNQSISSENLAHDRSQERPQERGQYEPYRPTPASLEPQQRSVRSPQYLEDVPPRFQSQSDQYRPYQLPSSANASQQSLTVPNQSHNDHSTHSLQEQYEAFRPPSEASLNPPSPTEQFQQSDSRPSTAQAGRYSAQSQTPSQLSVNMPRGEVPSNGGLRQQLSSQRDPRPDARSDPRSDPRAEPRSDDHTQYSNSQDPRVRMAQQTSELGRSTPPPRGNDDAGNLDVQQLLSKYQELQSKYSKVKRYYFDQQAQVTQLQNTIANQRLSMSRTSVDDAGYEGRFLRLSQAVNNFSFNIRKDWREIPQWLRPVCNQDAPLVGKQEMTAVGRAYISRWLFQHIFEQYFHPAIEANLSVHLKNIERNIRRGPKIMLTEEQRDDATVKLTTWRLTTIEGLQDILSSRQAQQNRENLAKSLAHDLNEELKSILNEPTSPGVGDEVYSIVTSALEIAYHIPLESRDICVEYFMPGTPIDTTYMKVADPIAPLLNPGTDERSGMQVKDEPQDQTDAMSTSSGASDRERDVESEIRDASAKAAQKAAGTGAGPGVLQSYPSSKSEKSIKSSLLGGLGLSKKPTPQQQSSRLISSDTHSPEAHTSHGAAQAGEQENSGGRVRFAVFLCVEVRGKPSGPSKEGNSGVAGQNAGAGGTVSNASGGTNVLFKAPVFEY